MAQCEYCKCKVTEDEKVCSQCGAPIKPGKDKKKADDDVTFTFTATFKNDTTQSKQPKKKATANKYGKKILIIFIVFFSITLLFGLIINNQNQTTSKNPKPPGTGNEITIDDTPVKSPIIERLDGMGYYSKYKSNDNSELLLYISADYNNYLGLLIDNTSADKPQYYFYGELSDLSTAYVFYSENTSEISTEDFCLLQIENTSTKDLIDCSKDNKPTYTELKENYKSWLSKSKSVGMNDKQLVLHLTNLKDSAKSNITFLNKHFPEKGYQLSVSNDKQLLMTSPMDLSLEINFNEYGIVDTITYTNLKNEINHEYVYSINKNITINEEIQENISKDFDDTKFNDFKLLQLYFNSYYFSHITN